MRRGLAALGGLVVLGAAGAAKAAAPAPSGIAFDRLASLDFSTGISHSNIWITTGRGRVRTLVKRRRLSAIEPSWSPNGRTLAFAADCSFKYQLSCSSVWRVNSNGSGLRKLSTGESQDSCPAWSPDGKRIAFRAEFGGAQNLDSGIYAMNADGTARTPVDKGELNGCPAWSPDGELIAFTRANGLYVVGGDGSAEYEIASDVGHYDGEPDWSPDGSHIAFAKTGANGSVVYVIGVDGSARRSIARGTSPAWSPDGRRIAFARAGEIYVIGANGGRAVRVTRQRMRSAGHPTWRP